MQKIHIGLTFARRFDLLSARVGGWFGGGARTRIDRMQRSMLQMLFGEGWVAK